MKTPYQYISNIFKSASSTGMNYFQLNILKQILTHFAKRDLEYFNRIMDKQPLAHKLTLFPKHTYGLRRPHLETGNIQNIANQLGIDIAHQEDIQKILIWLKQQNVSDLIFAFCDINLFWNHTKKALNWYSLIAESKPQAESELSLLCWRNGLIEQAVNLLDMAAAKNDTRALLALCEIYAKGLGNIQQDSTMALEYYNYAFDHASNKIQADLPSWAERLGIDLIELRQTAESEDMNMETRVSPLRSN